MRLTKITQISVLTFYEISIYISKFGTILEYFNNSQVPRELICPTQLSGKYLSTISLILAWLV